MAAGIDSARAASGEVVITHASMSTSTIPLWVAQRQNFFAKYGVNVKKRMGTRQSGANRHAGIRRHANRLRRRTDRHRRRCRRPRDENHRQPEQPRESRSGRSPGHPIAPKICAANASAFKVSAAACGKPPPYGWNISAWMSDGTIFR